MRLSAIDIKKQEFKRSMRGYDPGEVEAYLDTVGNTVENLIREIEFQKEQLEKLAAEKDELANEIQVYRENEKTFQKAIVKSQDMAEEVVENAKKRAELIIKEAEILSSKTRLQAQEEFLNLKQELEDLKQRNESIIDDIKNYLAEKLNSIDEYQRNRKIFKLENNLSKIENVRSEEHSSGNTFGMDFSSQGFNPESKENESSEGTGNLSSFNFGRDEKNQ
jgi:cell division initiation protein